MGKVMPVGGLFFFDRTTNRRDGISAAEKEPNVQLQFDLQPNICKKMRGASKMITSGYELSRECIKEIELQINQRLFETGVISSDMYKLAKKKIVEGE